MSARGLISALPIMVKRQSEESAFRDYTALCLYNIGQCVAKTGGGEYVTVKFHDLMNPKPEDKRTSKEVVDHIKSKLKALGGGSD